MADELGAELSLDLDSARREIESFRRDIEDELERAVSTFGDEYEREIRGLPAIDPEINSDAVTEELNGAIRSVDAQLAVTPDVDALQTEVADALGAVRPPIEVNTDPVVTQIEGLFDSFHPELTPELDTTAVQRALGDLEGAAGGLDIGAGFDDAALQGQELADVLADIESGSEEAGDGLGSVSNVSTTLATAFSAARGDGRKLISDLAQIRGGFGGVAAGALALGAGFTALFEAGERSLASTERATVVLGDAASRIETIDVGGLSGSLSDLAIQAGQSGGKLRDAASSAAQVGLSAGASKEQVTEFANNVNALALRAVALNPALGDAGSVAQRLNTVLARGGRFLARYGIDLTAAEITTRALADTGKTAVRDLSLFERSVAGANIAVEKLGTALGRDFERGTATTTVRIASIRAELNSAFSRAGKPLVEPTITAFEALAEAGAGVSLALGRLGQAVLPVVAVGLESIGASAGVAVDALNLIPGPALAIGAAFALLRKPVLGFFDDLRFASRTADAGQLILPGLEQRGNRVTATLGAVAQKLDTFAGRSAVAFGATLALDQGLKALGTSTEELGIQFITTGAAIGFAVGGFQGALVGAGIGAIAQAVAATSDLEQATKEVDEQFQKAESSSGDLRAALFAGADTAVGLAAAIAGLDANLAKFVTDASAFKALKLNDDLRSMGISAQEVGRLAQEGEAGLAQFIARAERAGEISFNVAKALTNELGPGVGETAIANLNATAEELRNLAGEDDIAAQAVVQLRHRLDDLGVGAKVTAAELAAMTGEQRRNILAVLRADGANTGLVASFITLQKQIRRTEREQFDLFASTNKLSPAVQRAARELSRGGDGAVDWAKALGILGDAAVGIIPEFGRLTAQASLLRRELTGIIDATTSAAATIPTLGGGLSQALETAFFEASENITGKPLLDPEALIGNLNTATFDFGVFFGNIQKIAETGAGNVATALLQLGPGNLGARVAAELAANEPLFREGLEKALEGMSKAQLVSDSVLSSLKARASLLASIQGSTFEELLQKEFGEVDVSKLSNAQLVAFIQTFGEGATPEIRAAASNFVNTVNTEIAARKIAGLDTQPIFDSINEAKKKMPAEAQGLIDVYTQTIDGTAPSTTAAAEKLVEPIPKALTDIEPEVIAGISQVGDLLTTGSARATDEYEREFRIFQVTQRALEASRTAVVNEQTPITNAITGTVVGAIDDAGFSAGVAGFGLGVRIGQGIAYGLNGDEVARATQQAIDERIDEIDRMAREAMDGRSPARRFYPHGRDIAAGIAVGIGQSTAPEDALAAKIGALAGGGGAGFGNAPTPPAGLAPIVHVHLDPSMMSSSSIDSSITIDAVHNYGPDTDARGQGLVRALRDYQFTG